MNNMTLTAEALRQGEVETERRLRMGKLFSGNAGAKNPLIEFYKDDEEICRLQADKSRLRENLWNNYLNSPLCCLPCFWPHQLILGMPCMTCFSVLPKIDERADAHTIILRKNSIVWKVEPYDNLVAQESTFALVQVPICCAFGAGYTEPLEEVFPRK